MGTNVHVFFQFLSKFLD